MSESADRGAADSDGGAALPPDVLEQLRRSVPLRMSAMGQWIMGGEAITHARVIAALRTGLDLADNGDVTVRIGTHWCYVTVDDCPLRATAVDRSDSGAPRLRLDDGRSVGLDPSTLWDEPGLGLRCTAPARDSGRPLAVRFTNAAQMDLLPWLTIDDDGGATLEVGGTRYAVGNVANVPA